jgi:hypothetical protein
MRGNGEVGEHNGWPASARWPSKELVADQSQGVQLATLQALARYWATDYDLRRMEAWLNALPQFRTEIDGDIHLLHVKSPHPDALPLLITHCWPGSVIELLEVVGPLADPTSHGGRAEDASTWCCRRCPAMASPASRVRSAEAPTTAGRPGRS